MFTFRMDSFQCVTTDFTVNSSFFKSVRRQVCYNRCRHIEKSFNEDQIIESKTNSFLRRAALQFHSKNWFITADKGALNDRPIKIENLNFKRIFSLFFSLFFSFSLFSFLFGREKRGRMKERKRERERERERERKCCMLLLIHHYNVSFFCPTSSSFSFCCFVLFVAADVIEWDLLFSGW